MANLEGMRMKFIVAKNRDIKTILKINPHLKGAVTDFFDKLQAHEEITGKSDHRYLVINTDEPYADEVIEILKRHGHWG